MKSGVIKMQTSPIKWHREMLTLRGVRGAYGLDGRQISNVPRFFFLLIALVSEFLCGLGLLCCASSCCLHPLP